MLTAFLPYIICAFLIIEGGFSKRMWGIIAALLPAFLVSALVILFGRGDSLIVNDICASLLSAAPRNCLEGGAIGNLSHNIGLAHDVVRYYNDKETKNVYLLSLILGLIPILIYYFSRHVKKFFIGNRIKFWYLGAIMFTIILSLPLLWVVADYGRLIYIHIVSSSLMLFLINDKVNNQTITVNLWWVSSWVFSLLYIFGWRLIHIDASFNSVFPFMKIVNKLFS